MIDFMLQNPGIPSRRFHRAELSSFVQAFYVYGPGPWNDCGKSGEAEAAFVERRFAISCQTDLRIDDHLEGYGPAIFVRKFPRRQILQRFFAILNYGKLQRKSDLRCGKPEARSLEHGFSHVMDQPLDLFTQYFLVAQWTSPLPQDGLSCLHNL